MKVGAAFNPWRKFVSICIPSKLAASKAFSPTAKLAYGHLARRAGENGQCFPSRRDIADGIGVTEGQVKRVLRELVDGKLLRVAARIAPNGRQSTNAYEFIWHELLDEGEGVKNAPLPVNSPGTGSEMAPRGVQKRTPRGVQKRPPLKRDTVSETRKRR